ncbi:MAG: glycosyltransferase family 4 protein [Bacteroidota bacterium]
MEKKKIVFLYTELATYFLACIEKLLQHPAIEVHIVHWPVNKEAPFDFSFPNSIFMYTRNDSASDQQLQQLIIKINPSLIYSSGWLDKGYLKICKQYKKKIPVIVGFDNQWEGSFKQRLAVLISPFRILNHFSHCWVPGDLQYDYALRLGFDKTNILTGFYSCNFDFFHNQHLINKQKKKNQFPKRFLYVGRYVEHKGINDLWNAFIELQNEDPNDWELWFIGTGAIEPVKHPKIKHFGFVQPGDLPQYIKDTGVFVLPSHFEPWGVVVHEFAAAGFPIICSDKVGAAGTFIEENVNGLIYKAGSIMELKKQLKAVMALDTAQLFHMGEKSLEKAREITPKTWAETLMKVIKPLN